MLYAEYQSYNYRFNVYLLNNSIIFSYEQNFFLGKLAFDCDILRNFAIGGLSLIKRRTTIYICLIKICLKKEEKAKMRKFSQTMNS